MALFSKTLSAEGFYLHEIGQSCMFDAPSQTTMLYNAGDVDDDTSRDIKTHSFWIKRSTIGSLQYIFGWYFSSNLYYYIAFTSADKLQIISNISGGGNEVDLLTTQVFRDCSGWYHIHFLMDTTDATEADRVILTVNGTRITDFDIETYGIQNADVWYDTYNGGSNDGVRTTVGDLIANNNPFSGYLAEIYHLDGEAQPASAFGEFKKGIWVPKAPVGLTYGNQGTYLDFADASDLGDDESGNTNDFVETNFGTDHQVSDSPTNNYCILDWNTRYTHANSDITEGGLSFNYTAGAAWITALGTYLMKSGKWYWEINVGSDDLYEGAGIVAAGENSGDITTAAHFPGQSATGYGVLWDYGATQRLYTNNGYVATTNIGAITVSTDVLQVAFDADNNKLWFGQNNTWDTGSPSAGTSPSFDSSDGINSYLYDYTPAKSTYGQTDYPVASRWNFGQRTFAYSPPTGFKALCTKNLPRPTIINTSNFMDIVLYEGTGAELEISDLLFQPDWVWFKNRDSAYSHQLYDSQRGVQQYMLPDLSNVEGTLPTGLTSFDSDGFTVGSHVGVNNSGDSIVAWCLKEGTVAGFDIQKWVADGAASKTISHNLGAVPEMIITKNRTDAYSWPTYHHAAGNKTDPETDYAFIDTNDPWADSASAWNDTAPTSTEFTVGIWGSQPTSSNYVAYIWRSIPGFSKVFSYVGNGNAAGPYVNCGFRPRWMIYKNVSATDAWVIVDTERDTYNPVYKYLVAQDTTAESSLLLLDFYSNGFKIRSTYPSGNGNNQTIVGIAFAEQPFKYANAR